MTRAVLALSTLILLASCQGNPPNPVPPAGASGPIPGVIPWTPLTPNLTPPSPALGPAPLPPGTLPCQAPDLNVVIIGSQGATGHIETSFAFSGAGSGPCYLDGTPSVGLVDSIGHAIAIRQRTPYMPPLEPGSALIVPGPLPAPHTALVPGQAGLSIDWVSQPEVCPNTNPVTPAQALIAIPGGGVVAVAIPPAPAAYACQGLGVGAFEGPYVPIQPSPPPPLPAISMSVPSAGRVGVALPYLVTLTNDHAQALNLTALCPTYEEELIPGDLQNGGPPLGGKHTYALNCGPAGTLAPGGAATFQMVFLVPADAAPGKYTLFFGLGYWNGISSYSQATVTLK
ncbi:MAG TPA: DUF4232 domain-containing protein [Candidatus Angelobacter sp.]|jgi:hypothetical protein|nr:DUF4232 domain-containing protein [Candidatus Angelobacter sp.]